MRNLKTRPIRSVLARRKMFANGGMMAPNIAPQGPAGILASSQPLMQAAGRSFVDSMTQDAVNPMGGGTMAMAEGGVAGFENGGLYNFPLYGGAVSNPQAMVPTSLSPSGQISVQRARTETDAERLIRQFPRRQAGGIPVIGKAPGETYGPDPSGLLGKAARQVPGRAGTGLEATARAFGDIATEVDLFLGKQFRHDTDIYRWLFSDEEEISGRTFSQRRVLTDLISIQPERKDEILEVGAGLIGAGIGLDSAEQFAQEIAKSLSMRHEAAGVHKAAGVRELAEDEYGGYPASGIIMTDAEREAAAKAPIAVAEAPAYDDEMEFYNQDLRQDIEAYRQATLDGEDSRMKFAQDLSARGVTQNYIDTVLQSAGDVGLGPTPDDTSASSTAGSRRIDQTITPLITPPRHKPTAEERDEALYAGGDMVFPLKDAQKLIDENSVANQVVAGDPASDKAAQTNLMAILEKYAENTAPAVKGKAVENVVIDALNASEGDKSVDINQLKRDLENLLPAVEDDPQMSGYLLAMIGATLATTPGDFLTALGETGKKTIPLMMNYHSKQKEAQRSRDMSIAKMAIQQKLSLEAEGRAEARKIRTEKRAQTRKDAEINGYTVTRDAVVDASKIDKDLTGAFKVPALTMYHTDKAGLKRLQGLGLTVVETGPMTISYKDLAKNLNPSTELTIADLARTTTASSFMAWKDGKNPGIKINYNAARLLRGSDRKVIGTSEDTITSGNWRAIYKGYEGRVKPLLDMQKRMTELLTLDKKKMVGIPGLKQRIGTLLRGLGTSTYEGPGILGYMDRIGKQLLDGQEVSEANRFEATGRLLLAEITPMILGESGKTISDMDRARVARALGFTIDVIPASQGGGINVLEFNANTLKNPAAIQFALNETARVLQNARGKLDQKLSGYMAKYAVFYESKKEKQEMERTRAVDPTPYLEHKRGKYFDLRLT
jgi:hypothetical protein